jgi:hypothetical protein
MLNIHGKIREKLDAFCASKKIPHLLFTGAPGTGKRTMLFDFLHKIYNNDKANMKSNIMFVNCAHGKGIKFIREDIKFFAKMNIQLNRGVLFKSVVLLNADFLTIDAQSALRRCIEQFSMNTRFFLIVENKQKLLNPILSRFCEIYFPEYIQPENGEIMNLHQYHIQQKNNAHYLNHIKDVHETKLVERMKAFLISYSQIKPNEMTELVNELYNEGYSGLDLHKWIQKYSGLSESYTTTISMIFHKIRSEYRCEKLLMLYILDKIRIYLCEKRDMIKEINSVGFI